jgi:hypothetical protein
MPKKEAPKSDICDKENQTKPGQLSPKTCLALKTNSLTLRYKEGYINAVRYNIKINKLV